MRLKAWLGSRIGVQDRLTRHAPCPGEHRLGPHRLALIVGVPRSTIGDVLARHGLSRLADQDGPSGIPIRYVRERPGELLHIDVKKLGRIPDGGGHRVRGRVTGTPRSRGAGYDYLHVAIDDMSRVAYVGAFGDERGTTCARFLLDAAAFFARHASAWTFRKGLLHGEPPKGLNDQEVPADGKRPARGYFSGAAVRGESLPILVIGQLHPVAVFVASAGFETPDDDFTRTEPAFPCQSNYLSCHSHVVLGLSFAEQPCSLSEPLLCISFDSKQGWRGLPDRDHRRRREAHLVLPLRTPAKSCKGLEFSGIA